MVTFKSTLEREKADCAVVASSEKGGSGWGKVKGHTNWVRVGDVRIEASSGIINIALRQKDVHCTDVILENTAGTL